MLALREESTENTAIYVVLQCIEGLITRVGAPPTRKLYRLSTIGPRDLRYVKDASFRSGVWARHILFKVPGASYQNSSLCLQNGVLQSIELVSQIRYRPTQR